MVIQNIVFENFGVYAGRQELDLTLAPDSYFDRPVILFHGKNGVGKTSFVEGVRLVLHGSLALGDRISQRAYLEHLQQRIHRPATTTVPRPDSASITMAFEMVREARTNHYVVTRRWQLASTGSIAEEIDVLENGQPPLNVAAENYGPFLRDLVSPSASELFFFDGEKIDRLTSDEGADAILADAVQRLLGLNLVQQLEADLSVYLGRLAGQISEEEMQVLEDEKKALQRDLDKLKNRHDAAGRDIADVYAAIARQEQELADKGGIYAKEYPRLKSERARLSQDIEDLKRRMQDAASGLLPFAAAPKLTRQVLLRLDSEAQQQQQRQVAQLLAARRADLLRRLAEDDFWKRIGVKELDGQQREQLADLVADALSNPADDATKPADVFIHASERDRTTMLSQLGEALGGVSYSFHELADKLIVAEAELAKVEEGLKMAPSDLILQPIFDVIQQLNVTLVEKQQAQQQLVEDVAAATFKLEQSNTRVKRAAEAVEASRRGNLAQRAQRAINAYAQKLRVKKLEALQVEIIKRFNYLCRKGALLDAAYIDPATFTITLTRNGEQFPRNLLSAGEKQLFALSVLWGLREVAGLPMPVIIDTPLGRLDSDHRLAMLRKFLPEVAHQVILLATDTEINATVIDELAPAISHSYQMVFDPASGGTIVEPLDVRNMILTETLA